MLLLREGIEIFSNMFWIRGEGSVYFNIREEGSVIQASLRGVECNLLFILKVSSLQMSKIIILIKEPEIKNHKEHQLTN